MGMLEDALAQFQAGRADEGIRLVQLAADNGEGDAAFVLAHWRLNAMHGPRDPVEARRRLGQAAAAGNFEGAFILATLLNNGTGGAIDSVGAAKLLQGIAPRYAEAADELALLGQTAPVASAERVRAEPEVVWARGFLSDAECTYLIDRATPYLQTSYVFDGQGNRTANPERTSQGMSFGPSLETPVVRAINARIAALTGTDIEWGEPLHMLRYLPGEEYRPHVDAIPGVRNQRQTTVLLYLNDGYGGGETRFEGGLDLKGARGDALVFANLDGEGRAEMRSKHAGLPVASGEKWLATRWIRQQPYHPWRDAR